MMTEPDGVVGDGAERGRMEEAEDDDWDGAIVAGVAITSNGPDAQIYLDIAGFFPVSLPLSLSLFSLSFSRK